VFDSARRAGAHVRGVYSVWAMCMNFSRRLLIDGVSCVTSLKQLSVASAVGDAFVLVVWCGRSVLEFARAWAVYRGVTIIFLVVVLVSSLVFFDFLYHDACQGLGADSFHELLGV